MITCFRFALKAPVQEPMCALQNEARSSHSQRSRDAERNTPGKGCRECERAHAIEGGEAVARVLIVDGDRRLRVRAAELLREQGHDVAAVVSVTEALARGAAERFELVVLGGRPEGAELRSEPELVRALRDALPDATLVLAGEGALESGEAAGVRNARREPEALVAAVCEGLALACDSDVPAVEADAGGATPFSPIVGSSPAIRELLRLVAKVAETDSTVLVTGETGTGKELIGRALHQASRRRSRVFCGVNSAAFPEALLESELYGHRRGAFTGASANKKGLFEYADGGTVFLDEVAEMPLSMQAKLLRFLQSGEVRAVGSESSRYVDVRLVTATNKDLEAEVAAGRFREDLYYRLAVIPIVVPPLRDRPEDIPVLTHHFLRRFAQRAGKVVDGVDPSVMELLASYSWPGNVRQLENVVESGVALCQSRWLSMADLPARLRERPVQVASDSMQSLETLERNHILRTLERVGWNRKRASEILEISTTTLWRRLKEFQIDDRGASAGRL
jgi:DNA-binding NtrC family response regulator